MKMPHDSWADYYDLVFSDIDRDYTKLTLDTIKSILPDGGTIIDFGAGTGRISIPLAKNGYSVTAIEQSKRNGARYGCQVNTARCTFEY
jgi:2-polyprenyl-3-methyl-5-hydroxy-6-metoxy-1,4-benzoquinol methylase